VVATGIFILLLLTLLSMRLKRRWPSVVLFMLSLTAIALLLSHHSTNTLNVSF
jgi:hypothetical protein